MSNIAILRYNNYANRIVKGYQTLEAYRQELGRSGHEIVYTFYNINFSPNDGVDSELVLNMPVDNVNYLIVYEGTEQEENEQIISRWFILDADRLRNGQYKINLKRDVIYDNLEAVVKSTAFINRGYVGVTDPAIYNSESITTNQIKTSETLLKQYNIDTPWIVGYLTDTDSAELV